MPEPGFPSMQFAVNPSDGAKIAYRVSGSGTPVVMVHGTALSQAIWRGFGYVRDLARDHLVITLDLRGHGRSTKPHDRASYRMGRFVSDVLAVLDALAVERTHYIGYSLGGRVGFSLAVAAPQRLERFINAGGAPATAPGSFDRVFFPGCADVLALKGMAGFISTWERHNGAALDSTTRAAFLANDALALAAYMNQSEDDPGISDRDTARIAAPTLLLAGSEDRERVRTSERAAALMPDASLRILHGATHSSTLRHPDALPSVRAFLTGRPTGLALLAPAPTP